MEVAASHIKPFILPLKTVFLSKNLLYISILSLRVPLFSSLYPPLYRLSAIILGASVLTMKVVLFLNK